MERFIKQNVCKFKPTSWIIDVLDFGLVDENFPCGGGMDLLWNKEIHMAQNVEINYYTISMS